MAHGQTAGTVVSPSSPTRWPAGLCRERPTVQILIDERQILDRVAALGRQIEDDFRGRPLTIVAVLTGSLVFLADLTRRITIPHRIALWQASSYRGLATRPEALRLNESFSPDVAGRDVLVLDDILDTGRTLSKVASRLVERGALSVRTAVLLRKLGRQEVAFEPDYCGFEIPDAFVVGYGLDFNDDYRHLPHIGVLDATDTQAPGRPTPSPAPTLSLPQPE